MSADRYDDLMLGIYRGTVPEWLTGTQRDLFLRESLRRRCELSLKLRRLWPCTTYLARCLHTDDFALDVFKALPDHVSPTVDMNGALYLGLADALRGPAHLVELFTYESLALSELTCEVRGDRVGDVYRFAFDIQAIWGRLSMYATSFAPAEFGRSYVPVPGPTFMSRTRAGDKWTLTDVTEDHA